MIHELDRTLAKLLGNAFGEQPITVDFQAPTRSWSVEKPAVNLFLFDVRENSQLRQYRWDRVVDSGHNGVHRTQPPLVFDCTYLVTCWAATPEQEHWLLAQCLRALANDPVLESIEREGSLASVEGITTKLGTPEQLTNPTDIWSVLENTLRPALMYCVTLPFARAIEEMPESLVHAIEFRWRQVESPVKTAAVGNPLALSQSGPLEKKRALLPVQGTESTTFAIAGTARNSDGVPLEGVRVRIAGDASFVLTDENGRYTLGRLTIGTYTLVAQTIGGIVLEKAIEIISNEPIDTKDTRSEASFDFEMEIDME